MNNDDFQERAEISLATLKRLQNGPLSPAEQREIKLKEDLLAYLMEEEEYQLSLQEPRVFVSFAGKSGPSLFKKMLRVLRDDGRIAVAHAMGDQGEPTVLGVIRSRMRTCKIFLGILTKEYDLGIVDDEENRYAPGKWVMLELGMALSMDLRIILLVEKGVHKDFWLDPVNNWRHVQFAGAEHFETAAKRALGRLWSHYLEVRPGLQY